MATNVTFALDGQMDGWPVLKLIKGQNNICNAIISPQYHYLLIAKQLPVVSYPPADVCERCCLRLD